MFWIRIIKKNRYTTAKLNPSFFYINVGFKGVYISQTCSSDVRSCGEVGSKDRLHSNNDQTAKTNEPCGKTQSRLQGYYKK